MSAAPASSAVARLRGLLALTCVLVFMVAGALWQRLFVWPLAYALPGRRRALVSSYMRGMSAVIFALFELGGARFERRGRVPTGEPCLLLMNHQSLLDITTVVLMCAPYVPVFVTRRRYAWGVPAVSPCLRLLGCPLIDPKRDARGAAATIAAAFAREPHGLVIFPEGHRTRDGSIGAFKASGTEAALRLRRTPVYLVVTDGFWRARRLADFVFHAADLQGRTEVLGPFEPPTEDGGLPAFIQGLRATMVARLEELRRADHGRS